MQDESLATRNLATIVYRLGGGKDSIDRIWPINGEERETIAPISREKWDMIKHKQKIIDQNIADARIKHTNNRRPKQR